MIRNLRLSKMSASAPAGNANRNTGSVVAVCTNATTKGSGLRLVISQPDAALYIQPPTLETRVPVQTTAKTGWRNVGGSDTDLLDEASPVVLLIAFSYRFSANASARANPQFSGCRLRAVGSPERDLRFDEGSVVLPIDR